MLNLYLKLEEKETLTEDIFYNMGTALFTLYHLIQAWVCGSVMEHLSNTHKALGFHPQHCKKEKKSQSSWQQRKDNIPNYSWENYGSQAGEVFKNSKH